MYSILESAVKSLLKKSPLSSQFANERVSLRIWLAVSPRAVMAMLMTFEACIALPSMLGGGEETACTRIFAPLGASSVLLVNTLFAILGGSFYEDWRVAIDTAFTIVHALNQLAIVLLVPELQGPVLILLRFLSISTLICTTGGPLIWAWCQMTLVTVFFLLTQAMTQAAEYVQVSLPAYICASLIVCLISPLVQLYWETNKEAVSVWGQPQIPFSGRSFSSAFTFPPLMPANQLAPLPVVLQTQTPIMYQQPPVVTHAVSELQPKPSSNNEQYLDKSSCPVDIASVLRQRRVLKEQLMQSLQLELDQLQRAQEWSEQQGDLCCELQLTDPPLSPLPPSSPAYTDHMEYSGTHQYSEGGNKSLPLWFLGGNASCSMAQAPDGDTKGPSQTAPTVTMDLQALLQDLQSGLNFAEDDVELESLLGSAWGDQTGSDSIFSDEDEDDTGTAITSGLLILPKREESSSSIPSDQESLPSQPRLSKVGISRESSGLFATVRSLTPVRKPARNLRRSVSMLNAKRTVERAPNLEAAFAAAWATTQSSSQLEAYSSILSSNHRLTEKHSSEGCLSSGRMVSRSKRPASLSENRISSGQLFMHTSPLMRGDSRRSQPLLNMYVNAAFARSRSRLSTRTSTRDESKDWDLTAEAADDDCQLDFSDEELRLGPPFHANCRSSALTGAFALPPRISEEGPPMRGPTSVIKEV